MGAQHAKSSSSSGHLTTEEVANLRVIFDRIKLEDQDKSNQLRCSDKAFQKHCDHSLDNWLTLRISKKLTEKVGSKDPHTIPFQGIVHLISTALKGDIDEKIGLMLELCTEAEPKDKHIVITGAEIIKYARSIIESYLKSVGHSPAVKSWARSVPVTSGTVTVLTHNLLRDLIYPGGVPKDFIAKDDDSAVGSREYTLEESITGISKCALFLSLHDSVFSHCFNFDQEFYFTKYVIPHCRKILSPVTATKPTLLDLTRIIFLNHYLPVEFRDQWRFLFSTVTHGESFSKLIGLIKDKGPSVIIIRDSHGRVFGGYATNSWTPGPKFYGTSDAFLFHLSPKLMMYYPTNYNANFQYFNVQQKTLPNGLGMGGTLEYFGLWIDAEFGKGKCSPSCTTYSSPQLSVEEEFTIDHLEVWGIGPEPQLREEGERVPQSVLDREAEAKAVLEIIGKSASASDGYRDPEPHE